MSTLHQNHEDELESGLNADQVQFVADFPPPLVADDYTVTIEHRLKLAKAGDVALTKNELRFHVSAPQLRLESGLVTGQYPPRGRNGALGTTLCHVTFGRRTLPWERREGDAPWLALLVLHEQDADDFRLRRGVSLTELLGDDMDGPAIAGELEPAARREDGTPDPGFSLDVLELSAELFTAIAPSPADATLLAHVRHAHIGAKTRATGAETGWFPTVVANRFPDKGLNTAVLVSLEGHGIRLPGGGTAPTRWVRMVALSDWTFTVDPATDPHDHPNLDLASLLTDLDAGPLAIDPKGLEEPSPAVEQLLAEGRFVLPWRDRLGRQVPALYHGPLLPYRMHRRTVTMHDDQRDVQAVLDSDALLQLDRSTGLFDISLATAWQLGRLRQLADRAGAAQILAWRRAAHQELHRQSARVESSVLAEPVERVERALRRWAGFEAFVSTAELPQGDDAVYDALSFEEAFFTIPTELQAREPTLSRESCNRVFRAMTGHSEMVQELQRLPPPGVARGSSPLVRAYVDIGRRLAFELLEQLREDFEAAAPPGEHESLTAGGFLARRRTTPHPVEPPPNADAIVERLEALARLEGIPFSHLVPDERLLPAESIRFFTTDPNWIASLLFGALSIGRSASHDRDHDHVNASALVDDDRLVMAKRDLNGFLLRSPELAGWDELEIRGSVLDPTGKRREVPIDHHRMLSNEVRLVLFADDIDLVEVRQPPEAIHFGARWTDDKYVTVPNAGDGKEIAMRDVQRRVVDVSKLAQAIAPAGLGRPMTSADLAEGLLSRIEAIAFPVSTPARAV